MSAQTAPLEGDGVFVAGSPQREDLGHRGGGHVLGKVSDGVEEGVSVP